MSITERKKACFHLPGLFEFYELYQVFLPLFYEHREWFYDWCEIGSIYGSPLNCIWGGGRIELEDTETDDVIKLLRKYKISARLTFSNSQLLEEHLKDRKCNELCLKFKSNDEVTNGIIIYSDLLMEHIKAAYPGYYFVSTTTKVITDFNTLKAELDRSDFKYVVPDFRLNKEFDKFRTLSKEQIDKIEFLCNECCFIGCKDRKACYENVSRKNLGENVPDHICTSLKGGKGYRFSDAMKNPSFIGIYDIVNTYMPYGFSNFKIEGRGLGSAVVLEMLLYYLAKPEYHINIREEIYLDNMLDLF